jgi:aminopeptidase N
MKRHWFLALLLVLSFSSSCVRSERDGVMAPYRPAMQERAQSQLDALHHLPRYDISVRIDPAAERQVTGWERVLVPHRGPDQLEELYFRLYPNLSRFGGGMSINGATVNGQTATFVYEADDTALRVNLPEPLLPDSEASVDLGFDLQVPRREKGYVLCGESQSILSLPLFYPTLAVREDRVDVHRWNLDIAPSIYGDPAFVEAGLYQVTATVPSEMVVAGTGTVITTTASSDGWSDVHFAGGPRREFMLILSSQFRTAGVDACGARITSYFLTGDEATGMAALQYAAAALRVYCEYFDPYPFQDMAVVSAPLQYFGMEFPGLNLIGIDLYRESRDDLEFLVAHEVAHQWWYSVVGNDPVNFAWLDEGLAEYATYTYYKARYGEPTAENRAELRWRIPYQYAVDQRLDTVVNQPLSGFLPSNYETMVYAKAALFFDAIRREVGDEPYYRILREYLDRYRYDIATPGDFLTVAEEVADRDLGQLYTQWILTATE